MRHCHMSCGCDNLRLIANVPLRLLISAYVVPRASVTSVHRSLCLETLATFDYL
jgi:hypothetical protein